MSIPKKLKNWNLILPALFILISAYQSSGQASLYDTTWMSAKTEIGLNPTILIRNTLWSGNNNFTLYPYEFMLNFKSGDRAYFRSAWDIAFANQKNEDDRKSSGFNVGFRLGVEGRKALSNRFGLFYGADLLGEFQSNKTETENSQGTVFTSEFGRTGFGLGPILGVMYRLNDALSIRTEGSMYLTYTKDTSKFESSSGGVEPVDEESSTTGMRFQSPINILLFLHF